MNKTELDSKVYSEYDEQVPDFRLDRLISLDRRFHDLGS